MSRWGWASGLRGSGSNLEREREEREREENGNKRRGNREERRHEMEEKEDKRVSPIVMLMTYQHLPIILISL